VPDVTREQARPQLDSGAWWLLDVREDEEWQRMHIPGAHHIPQSELATRLAEIPRQSVPLVVCQSGVRSHRAAQFLKQADFAHAVSLAGGTAGWHKAGLPVVTGDTTQTGVRLSEIVGPH
jgi:rhodanese-related sulfurtransferase